MNCLLWVVFQIFSIGALFRGNAASIPPRLRSKVIAHYYLDGNDEGLSENGQMLYAKERSSYSKRSAFFDGSSYLSTQNIIDMRTSSFTAAIWVKRRRGWNSEFVFTTSKWRFHITLQNYGKVKFYWTTSDNNANEVYTANGMIRESVWKHIAVTLNSNSNEMKIFISGESAAVHTVSGSLDPWLQDHLQFGSRDGTSYFKGFLEDAFLIGEAATENEIKEIMNWMSPGGTILHWRLDNINDKGHILDNVMSVNGTLVGGGRETFLKKHALYFDDGKHFRIDNLKSAVVDPETNTSAGFSLSFWVKKGGFASEILGNDDFSHQQMHRLISPYVHPTSSWTRCYSSSSDGWDVSTFHQKCDYRGPTVTLVKRDGVVLGAYADVDFGGNVGYKSSGRTFLFASPKYSVDQWQRLFPKPGMEQYAIYNDPSKGPIFGKISYPDLGIGDKAHESETSYNFVGNVYETPFNYSETETLKYFGGSAGFIPSIVEVFYQVCHSPVGMEFGKIFDHQITAFSHEQAHPPSYARLHHSSAWQALTTGPGGQWLQVDLENELFIRAVATQGAPNQHFRIESYHVNHSLNGSTWVRYTEPTVNSLNHEEKLFTGNADSNTVVKNNFRIPFLARFIRIVPTSVNSRASLRAEIYASPVLSNLEGYLSGCSLDPVGLEQGLIPDEQLSTSSSPGLKNGLGLHRAGWVGTNVDENPWVQVDLRSQSQFVSKLATQGSGTGSYTREFYLDYSTDGRVWLTYVGLENKEKANSDDTTVVYHWLEVPIKVRILRLRIVSHQTLPGIRLEIYGCSSPERIQDESVSRNPVIVSSGADDGASGIVLYEHLEQYQLHLRTQYGIWKLNLAHMNPYWSHMSITWNEIRELCLYYDGERVGRTSSFEPLSSECSYSVRHGCTNRTGSALLFGKTARNVSNAVISNIQVADIILAEYELSETTSVLLNHEAGFVQDFQNRTSYWQNTAGDAGNWELMEESVFTSGDMCTNPGWTYDKGFCYKYFDTAVFFDVARQGCFQHGSDLASIHSEDENNLVFEVAAGNSIFIGAEFETTWLLHWVDQTKVDYTKFGQKNFESWLRCGELHSDKKWYYSNPETYKAYVCKKKADPVFHLASSFPYKKGDRVRLESPFMFGVYRCLRFKYLMRGSTVGRLNVYTESRDQEPVLLWRLAGNQESSWKNAEVSIDESNAFKVIFEGIIGEGVDGSISLSGLRLDRKFPCGLHPLKAIPPFKGNYRPIGCFNLLDPGSSHVFKTELGKVNTIMECANKVKERNMELFGLIENQCRAGIKEYHGTNVKSDECSWNGGDKIMTVYSITWQGSMCGPSWNEYQGYCYKAHNNKVDRDTAQNKCVLRHSNLASIHSAEEDEFVQRQMTRTTGRSDKISWIGLNDDTTSSWIDNTTVDFLNYRWSEPNSGSELCVNIYSDDKKWEDRPCNHLATFTCKRLAFGIYESDIIGHINPYKQYLYHWLTEVRQSFLAWKQCYRALLHGWDPQTFHRLCDNKGPTITIVRVNNAIVGGFSDKSWKSIRNNGANVSSLNGFIFTLNTSSQKFAIDSSKQLVALYHHENTGPCFSTDLCVGYTGDMRTLNLLPFAYGTAGQRLNIGNQGELRANDVEVLYTEDTLCLSCRAGTHCDYDTGQCLCNDENFKYYCPTDLTTLEPLGMESGKITRRQLSASPQYNNAAHYDKDFGRLSSLICWADSPDSIDPYFRVSFNEPVLISGVALQGTGEPGYQEWVETFKVRQGSETENLQYYDNGKVFEGNHNSHGETIFHKFRCPFRARQFEIRPLTWYAFCSMRLELYGWENLLNGKQPNFPYKLIEENPKSFWPFDGPDEIIDLPGNSWVALGGNVSQVVAVNKNGLALSKINTLTLSSTSEGFQVLCQQTPCSEFTLTFWLKYTGYGSRNLLKVGDDANANTGLFIHVNESKPDYLTVQVSSTAQTGKATFLAPEQVWTHLVVLWTDPEMTIFRNGRKLDLTDSKIGTYEYIAEKRSIFVSKGIELTGDAIFDDLTMWTLALSHNEIYRLYTFYRGRMCDNFWVMYGGYCYNIVDHSLSQSSAEAYCSEHGGHLVSFHEKGEVQFTSNLMADMNIDEVWIGFHTKQQREYFWTDGSKVDYIHHNSANMDEANKCFRYHRTQDNVAKSTCTNAQKFMCKTKAAEMKLYYANIILDLPNEPWDINLMQGTTAYNNLLRNIQSELEFACDVDIDFQRGTGVYAKISMTIPFAQNYVSPSTGMTIVSTTTKEIGYSCDHFVDGFCYKLFTDGKSQLAAETHCRTLGGNLPSFSTQDEWDDLLNMMRNTGVDNIWVGLTGSTGVYYFTDNTPVQYIMSLRDDTYQDCFRFLRNEIYDHYCSTNIWPYFCKIGSQPPEHLKQIDMVVQIPNGQWNNGLLHKETTVYQDLSVDVRQKMNLPSGAEIQFTSSIIANVSAFLGTSGYKGVEDLEKKLSSPAFRFNVTSFHSNKRGKLLHSFNLTLNSQPIASINISWNEIFEDYGDNIYQHIELCYLSFIEEKTSEGILNETCVQILSRKPNHFLVENLKPFTKYNVSARLITLLDVGDWEFATEISGDGYIESPPLNLRLVVMGSTSIQVSWYPPPEETWNGLLQGFKLVYYKTISGSQANTTIDVRYENDTVISHTTSNSRRRRYVEDENIIFTLNVTDLEEYTNYTFQVMAYHQIDGPYTPTVTAETDEDVPENSPSNISVLSLTPTEIFINWTHISEDEANGVVLGYVVYFQDLNRTTPVQNITVPSENTTSVLGNLLKYTWYRIQLQAFTRIGGGNLSRNFTCHTLEDAPERPPENLNARNTSSRSISASWNPPPKEFWNGPLRGFKVVYYETSLGSHVNTTVDVKQEDGQPITSSITNRKRRYINDVDMVYDLSITGLHEFTEYSVMVMSYNSFDGPYTSPVAVVTSEDVPSGPPLNISVNCTSSTEIAVNWELPSLYERNGIILNYKVLFQDLNRTDPVEQVTVPAENTTTILRNLGKFILYRVQLQAFTLFGGGPLGKNLTCRTLEDVPDAPPSNITAVGVNWTSIEVTWYQVPRFLRNGIIRGYKIQIFDTSGAMLQQVVFGPHQYSTFLQGLEPNAEYDINVTAFTNVGDGVIFMETAKTHEEPPTVPPLDVSLYTIDAWSMQFKWTYNPELANLKGTLRNYRVYYKAIGNSRDEMLHNITVNESTYSLVLKDLLPFTEYEVYVLAVSMYEGVRSNVTINKTLDDVPELPPSNFTAVYGDPWSLLVDWKTVPRHYENGIITKYVLSYYECQGSTLTFLKNLTFPANKRDTMIIKLKIWTFYQLELMAFTRIGAGPRKVIKARTQEDVPCAAPANATAGNWHTPYSIPIHWNAVPAGKENGIIQGFVVKLKPVMVGLDPVVDGGELKIRIKSNGTFFMNAEPLESFTTYQITVAAITSQGEGVFSPPFLAETCRCYQRLTTNWYDYPPYSNISAESEPGGIVPELVKTAVSYCCRTCKQWGGESYVDFEETFDGKRSLKLSGASVKLHVEDEADISFPLYGFKIQETYNGFPYSPFIESPGMVFVVISEERSTVVKAIVMSIFATWPFILVSVVLAMLAGAVMWGLECRSNPEQFPPTTIKGIYEGFWWAFISMTTVGYGDRFPITIPGRVFSVIWVLTGLVITGITVGSLTTAFAVIAGEEDVSLYNTEVAVIKDSPEYNLAVRLNAKVNPSGVNYTTFDEIYQALMSRSVRGILVDGYAAGEKRELLSKPNLRIKKIYDYITVYGIAWGNHSKKMRTCLRHFMQKKSTAIVDKLIESTKTFKEPDISEAAERASGLFDSSSEIFQQTLIILLAALGGGILLGTIWEILRRKKLRRMVGTEGHVLSSQFESKKSEMKQTVEDGVSKLHNAILSCKKRQLKELKRLYRAKK